jgi:superfamily II DNA helicase RecQ
MTVHYDMPQTLEGFYQESGRAGRDGAPARSVLFYAGGDHDTLEWFVTKAEEECAGTGDPRAARARAALGALEGYCLQEGCRRVALLRHFGEEATPALCARTCDCCRDPAGVAVGIAGAASSRDRSRDRRRLIYAEGGDDDRDGYQYRRDRRNFDY